MLNMHEDNFSTVSSGWVYEVSCLCTACNTFVTQNEAHVCPQTYPSTFRNPFDGTVFSPAIFEEPITFEETVELKLDEILKLLKDKK